MTFVMHGKNKQKAHIGRSSFLYFLALPPSKVDGLMVKNWSVLSYFCGFYCLMRELKAKGLWAHVGKQIKHFPFFSTDMYGHYSDN